MLHIASLSGIIPHSARPPSTNQSHARLTFVAKVSVDEFVGRRKAFTEEMRHYGGVVFSRRMIDSVEQGKGVINGTSSSPKILSLSL